MSAGLIHSRLPEDLCFCEALVDTCPVPIRADFTLFFLLCASQATAEDLSFVGCRLDGLSHMSLPRITWVASVLVSKCLLRVLRILEVIMLPMMKRRGEAGRCGCVCQVVD